MSGDDVHYFDGPGIEEGSGNVPKWFLVMMGALFVIFVAYIGDYLIDAQPNTAQMKSKQRTTQAGAATPAGASGQDEEQDGEDGDDGE